jgi:hypothetical protein
MELNVCLLHSHIDFCLPRGREYGRDSTHFTSEKGVCSTLIVAFLLRTLDALRTPRLMDQEKDHQIRISILQTPRFSIPPISHETEEDPHQTGESPPVPPVV